MKTSSGTDSTTFIDGALLTDREALRRMIQYARTEAEKEGEAECAELLSAALDTLELACTRHAVMAHAAAN